MSQDSGNAANSRRSFLTKTGAVGTIALAGCLGRSEDNGDESSDDDVETIRWVMNPAEETIDIQIQYQPLFQRIEDEFDVEIEGQPTQSYSHTLQDLDRAGEGDRVFADTSPIAVPTLGPDEIDVVGMREQHGAEQYFGTLVTTADSGITEISDLEGEAVATADAGSVSGGVAPLWLLQENGLDIGNAADGGSAEDFEWRSGVAHDLAVEELINDDTIMAAGAGGFASLPHVPAEQIEENFPEVAEISAEMPNAGSREPELRLLDASPPIPRAPIVVNTAWDEDLRYDIEEFMRDLETEELDHDAFDLADQLNLDLPDGLLEDYNDPDVSADPDEYDLDEDQQDDWSDFDDHTLWFTDIVEADHDDYQPINDFAEGLDIELDRLG
ncbi:phosphonate transport system substrate-binding protein [Natronobacterium texcoconense]|uniref:Phosphonate transport system substrate-binding protein n=2 Tax=Natronobacterium texcoconense TaxID=1095778 RepID=A0A1H1J259_NATTX|nr:phosphonate transport system substrate-binding protein [Natronobacterium texcoconense]